jgi:hypothetical protein
MHLGTRGKKFKTECLFCSASPAAYADPSTYDGADLSDIDMGQGKSIQCVLRNAPSLGTITSGDSSCEPEICRTKDQAAPPRVRLGGENEKQGIWI